MVEVPALTLKMLNFNVKLTFNFWARMAFGMIVFMLLLFRFLGVHIKSIFLIININMSINTSRIFKENELDKGFILRAND